MALNDKGYEVLDTKPVARAVNMQPPPSLFDKMRAFVRQELSRQAQDKGMETFAEADDFDVLDDPVDPSTPWELNFDQAEAMPPEPSPAPAAAPPAASPAAPKGEPTPPASTPG